MNTSYVGGQMATYGELRPALLTGTGPASYAAATGDPISNPAPGDYIAVANECTTQSGNYSLSAMPTSAGQIRAGGPSATQSGWTWIWTYSGKQGVATVVQNVAGTGMTPGTVVPIVFSGGGGAGAAGTVTVLTATTISIKITSVGGGYTSAPTATISGTGGTPATLTATVAPGSGSVPNGTNLSAEVVQFEAQITQL